MSESIRSFVAFDLNSESVLKKLGEVQRLLFETGADLKLVKPENIHMTLRFLGNISSGMVEKIFEEMKNVQFMPFDVKLYGVGAFPDARHPRVLWAAITDGSNMLRGIFDQLEPRIQNLGFPPDSKGFSPHLTIARVRSGRNREELSRCLLEKKDYEFGIIRAECLRLKKSDLTPKGPIYSTLKELCPGR